MQQVASAKKKSDQSSVEETLKLAVLSARTAGEGSIDFETLNNEINSKSISEYQGYVTTSGLSTNDITSLPTEVVINETHYQIEEDGTAIALTWYYAWKEDSGIYKIYGVTNGTTTLEIGDIVDYDCTTVSKEYESTADKNGDSSQIFSSTSYSGKWAVLGCEDGEILLMPTSDLGSLYLLGQVGYQYAESELDAICEIYGYGEGATGARSVDADDINKLTGYNPNNITEYDPLRTGSGTKYGEDEFWEYGNEVTYKWTTTAYRVEGEGKNGATGGYTSNASCYGTFGFNWYNELTKTWKSSMQDTTNPTTITVLVNVINPRKH